MTFGAVNFDYRAGRFHRKVDGLVGIIMIEEGTWVTSEKALNEFAIENDGECVIARAKFFKCGGNPYANCAFTSPDEARKKDATDWDWYFTDEPMIDERWNLEK